LTGFNPILLSDLTEKVVVKDNLRRYYRLSRFERWYGGISTAYSCGCNLRCVFCFSGYPRDHPESTGRFYSPEEVAKALIECAKKSTSQKLRVTGCEPTIGKKHFLDLLELVSSTSYWFILESNGILIGHDVSYARDLSRFKNLYVRISLKGTNPEEFSRLTGAVPEAFNLQLQSLKNLTDTGVQCRAAVMLSFSPKENLDYLKQELYKIHPYLADNIEEEYVILYPPVIERLNKAGIRPLVGFKPERKY
jgi:uncharacterized Fe-S cluster-containing radical SAM superfamily protein